MNVLINAVSARSGGGLTYLREIVPRLALALHQEETDTTVLVNPAGAHTLTKLANHNAHYRVVQPSWANSPAAVRQSLEQLCLPRLFTLSGMAAVLNVGDIMPLAAHMPNIVLCRNMLLYAPSDKSSLRLRSIRRLARLSLERAAAVAFVSHTLADQVRTQFDVRRSEVIHHGPGLTLPFREPADGPAAPSCLVVASLYDYKRVEIAIDAVAELRRRSYGATLEVVGQPVEPRYLQELEQRVEQLALHRYVSFQGSRGPEGIARSYSKAAFALITSRTESFCHPILEAFSAGVPALIAEDLAVASEIAGDAALYCRPVGFAFADAAESLMRSPTTYARYANAGRIRAREFSWSTAADRTCALILECAKAR